MECRVRSALWVGKMCIAVGADVAVKQVAKSKLSKGPTCILLASDCRMPPLGAAPPFSSKQLAGGSSHTGYTRSRRVRVSITTNSCTRHMHALQMFGDCKKQIGCSCLQWLHQGANAHRHRNPTPS